MMPSAVASRAVRPTSSPALPRDVRGLRPDAHDERVARAPLRGEAARRRAAHEDDRVGGPELGQRVLLLLDLDRSIGGDGIDESAASPQLLGERGVGDVRLRKKHMHPSERLQPGRDLLGRVPLRNERGLHSQLTKRRGRGCRADRGDPRPAEVVSRAFGEQRLRSRS